VAILIDETSRVVVQGITGREGTFHALRNRDYGTRIVAGVTPGKGGTEVSGIPVHDTVREAVAAEGADVSLVLVPARFAADAVYEAVDAGVRLVVVISEGIPVQELLDLHHWVRQQNATLIGPNGPGVISPGKATVGIMPTAVFTEGDVGIISRSGTLTYQVAQELTEHHIGQSTAVGIGGDAIPGSTFIEMLARFEQDVQTKAIVLIGEIGGSDEELAAAYVQENVTKPVLAYIVGFTAPPGKQMGHAGAIVSGTTGTAAGKKAALEAAGIPVAVDAAQIPELLVTRMA
jgi:succinyl-CoA synthetase alpha subunit